MRIALIGDAQSPHLLKWARALARCEGVQLWVASSRGFASGFDGVVATAQRLALNSQTAHDGGNVEVLAALPRLARWLRDIDADWVNAHYLTSHGTLAWLAKRLWRLRARIVGSAWGSDILLTPQRSIAHRWLTQRVLRACALTTSDSAHMAQRMRELGAREVMVFPFGLDALPGESVAKQPWLFFANRGLESLYRPQRVVSLFADVARERSDARLVVANDGSCAAAMRAHAAELRLADRIDFVGRLDAVAQGQHYARAQWYLSQPETDSVSVSVIEAMAHGCIPLLSDLPANRELVRDGENGRIVGDQDGIGLASLDALLGNAGAIAQRNRRWVKDNALFPPAVARLLSRLREIERGSATP